MNRGFLPPSASRNGRGSGGGGSGGGLHEQSFGTGQAMSSLSSGRDDFDDKATFEYVQGEMNSRLASFLSSDKDQKRKPKKMRDGTDLICISKSDIAEINKLALKDTNIQSAIQVIHNTMLAKKLYFLHKAFKIKPEYHNSLRAHWEAFLVDYMHNVLLYGICLVKIIKHPQLLEIPIVLDINLNTVQFAINADTNEYEYVVVNDLNGDVRDDVYVVSKYKPCPDGTLTSPTASLMDQRRWEMFVRNEYNMSSFYRGRPDVIIQEPAPEKPGNNQSLASQALPGLEGDTVGGSLGRGGHGGAAASRGGAKSQAWARDSRMAASLSISSNPEMNRQLEDREFLERFNKTNKAFTQEIAADIRKSTQHPLKKAYSVEYNSSLKSRVLRAMNGRHYVKPQLPQVPLHFEMIMNRTDDMIGRAYNVPREFWTGDHSSSRYTKGNVTLSWENMKTTVTRWASDVESLCNKILCKIYGTEDAVISAEMIYDEIMNADLSDRKKKEYIKMAKRAQEIHEELMGWYIVPDATAEEAIHHKLDTSRPDDNMNSRGSGSGSGSGSSSSSKIKTEALSNDGFGKNTPGSDQRLFHDKDGDITMSGLNQTDVKKDTAMAAASMGSESPAALLSKPNIYGTDNVEQFLNTQKTLPVPLKSIPGVAEPKKHKKEAESRQRYSELLMELTRVYDSVTHQNPYSFGTISLVLGWSVFVSDKDLAGDPQYAALENVTVGDDAKTFARAFEQKYGITEAEAQMNTGIGMDPLTTTQPDTFAGSNVSPKDKHQIVDAIIRSGYADSSQKDKIMQTLGEPLQSAKDGSKALPQTSQTNAWTLSEQDYAATEQQQQKQEQAKKKARTQAPAQITRDLDPPAEKSNDKASKKKDARPAQGSTRDDGNGSDLETPDTETPDKKSPPKKSRKPRDTDTKETKVNAEDANDNGDDDGDDSSSSSSSEDEDSDDGGDGGDDDDGKKKKKKKKASSEGRRKKNKTKASSKGRHKGTKRKSDSDSDSGEKKQASGSESQGSGRPPKRRKLSHERPRKTL